MRWEAVVCAIPTLLLAISAWRQLRDPRIAPSSHGPVRGSGGRRDAQDPPPAAHREPATR